VLRAGLVLHEAGQLPVQHVNRPASRARRRHNRRPGLRPQRVPVNTAEEPGGSASDMSESHSSLRICGNQHVQHCCDKSCGPYA
jgi:hypothetical protein